MSALLHAMSSHDDLTENLATAHSTTSNLVLDLFSQAGAMRSLPEETITQIFSKALGENALDAMRVLFWARDVRGGAGERRTFRVVLKWLANSYPTLIIKNINLIPHYGRWDDVFELFDTPCEEAALLLLTEALRSGDALCAKWSPRPKSAKAAYALKLRKALGLSEKAYRQLLSKLSNTVEQKMCAKQWDEIQYEHVPSLAMNRYRAAFIRHDIDRFGEFLDEVENGTKKIHAGVLYPHDIAAKYIGMDFYGACDIDPVLEAQWEALPNFFENNPYRIMPVIDVSGSMYGGGHPRPIDAAISLALYLAERNKGKFHNHFIEFSKEARLVRVSGRSLRDRVQGLKDLEWGYNTDVQGAFKMLLNAALSNQVPESEMPELLLCISDMQFDPSGYTGHETNFEAIKRLYEGAGYKMPKLVFWNVRGSGRAHPAKFDDKGVALISGYSPAILKFVMSAESTTPLEQMREVIDSERYQKVQA